MKMKTFVFAMIFALPTWARIVPCSAKGDWKETSSLYVQNTTFRFGSNCGSSGVADGKTVLKLNGKTVEMKDLKGVDARQIVKVRYRFTALCELTLGEVDIETKAQ